MKRTLITFFVVSLILLSGCSSTTNEQIIIKKICNNELEHLDGYTGGEVFKCGNYYKKVPPIGLLDAPDVIFDNEGNHVAFCGGMPGPVPREDPQQCDIECETINLC